MRKKPKRMLAVVALLALVLFPFEATVVPAQRVLVVDDHMRPLKGALVRQIWQHYSLERNGHEEDLRTDETGRLTFSRRTIRASILQRLVGPIINGLTQGVHASFGIRTHMLQLGGGTLASENAVEPREGEIVYQVRNSA